VGSDHGLCCEDEITAGKPGLVRERQARTTQMAWYFWLRHRSVPWVWVPTIQGWQIADYRQHARAMKPLIHTMQAYYARSTIFRVGIGTLCRRASVAMIHEVVRAVRRELPGIPLHLWGVKLGALQSRRGLPAAVVSVDSASWNSRFGRQIEEYKRSGLSQRKFAFTVALPRYLAKVERALRSGKRI
jgi:hypothetical protein